MTQGRYRDREPSSSRTPLIIAVVAVVALAAGFLLAQLLNDGPPGTASASPSASVDAASDPSAPGASAQASAGAPASGAPGASGGPAPVVQAPEGLIPPGSIARVVTDGLRLRAEPSTSASTLATLANGDLLAVGYSYMHPDWGPVDADGFGWYPVRPLGSRELPPVPSEPFAPGDNLGWVAAGSEGQAFLELMPPRCTEGDPDLVTLQTLMPWEQLACYGNRSFAIEGTYGCGGCGGLFPGTFEPEWLASPMNFDLLSVDANQRMGPMTLNFPPDGPERPEAGTIVRVTGHFDDPAAAECTVAPGDPPVARDQRTAQLYCRARFVVESIEVLGTDEDFPLG